MFVSQIKKKIEHCYSHFSVYFLIQYKMQNKKAITSSKEELKYCIFLINYLFYIILQVSPCKGLKQVFTRFAMIK